MKKLYNRILSFIKRKIFGEKQDDGIGFKIIKKWKNESSI